MKTEDAEVYCLAFSYCEWLLLLIDDGQELKARRFRRSQMAYSILATSNMMVWRW
jgi:hypothetical protein